jgi:hypothetical protein
VHEALHDGRVAQSRQLIADGWLTTNPAEHDFGVECLPVHLLPGEFVPAGAGVAVVVMRDGDPQPSSETRCDLLESLAVALEELGGIPTRMSTANRKLWMALGGLRYVLTLGPRPGIGAWQAGKRTLAEVDTAARMYVALKPEETEMRLLLLRARALARAWHAWGTP